MRRDFADTIVRFARGQARSEEVDRAVESLKSSILRASASEPYRRRPIDDPRRGDSRKDQDLVLEAH